MLHLQVDFFIPNLEYRYGVPDRVRWCHKGRSIDPKHNEADILSLIIFVSYVAGDYFYGGLEVIGVVILCAVEDESIWGLIVPLKCRSGYNRPTGSSVTGKAEAVLTASFSAATAATTVRL